MPTLFLHIGTPKTGTTAIQYFMSDNKKILESKGYSYPILRKGFSGIGNNRNAHFLIYKIYDEKKKNMLDEEKELVVECLDKIAEIAINFPNIVISDEGIWNGARKKADFWKNLKKELESRGIDLKIIVYLRRQDLFIQSYWAQQVKETLTVPFDEYISGGMYKICDLDYYAHLNEIENVLGRDNIIVRAYEKQQFVGTNKSVISDFLEAINLELTDEYRNIDMVQNLSLEGCCLEVKRILNNMPEYKTKSNFIVPLLTEVQAELIQDVGFEKCKYFSHENQQKFIAQYTESNCEVAKDYLNREDGILFKDGIQTNTHTKVSKYSMEELIFVCGKVAVLQQQKMKEIKEECKLEKPGLNEKIKKLKKAVKWLPIRVRRFLKFVKKVIVS